MKVGCHFLKQMLNCFHRLEQKRTLKVPNNDYECLNQSTYFIKATSRLLEQNRSLFCFLRGSKERSDIAHLYIVMIRMTVSSQHRKCWTISERVSCTLFTYLVKGFFLFKKQAFLRISHEFETLKG